MVRELGFMDATVAATDYPPSAVHTILEIGMRGPMTVGELGDFLRLEKSSVSRLVRKLIDGRRTEGNALMPTTRAVKPLSLTREGPAHAGGAARVRPAARCRGALAALTEAEQRTVREGLMLYARALRADRAAGIETAVA